MKNDAPSSRKAILITGAAAGIGKATAALFIQQGWFVGLAGRHLDTLEAVRAELGLEQCSCHRMDVTDFASVQQALAAFAQQTGGRLDLLLNNAGILAAGNFEEVPIEEHQRIAATNFIGVMNCCHAAFALLKGTPGARVINMSSASANYGAPSLASYSASKFAVRALTEALNVEWARHGIQVSDVMPLFVDTGMLDEQTRNRMKAISYLGVHLTPEDVARAVWDATRSRQVHARVGLSSKLLSLGQKYTPEVMQKQMVKLLSGY